VGAEHNNENIRRIEVARIRTIKPEFWINPQMARMDELTQLIAIALLNFADDEGYFFADPNLVRSQCRPYDDNSTKIKHSLELLQKIGYIKIIQTETHGAIGHIVNFTTHQKIDRPNSSNIKRFFESNNRRTFDEHSSNNRRKVDEQSSGERKGKERNILCSSDESMNDVCDSDFEVFWKAYPKKTGKGAAEKSWLKLKPNLKKVLAALEWQKETLQWKKDNKQFIPMPATYLNQRRWEDEPEAPAAPVFDLVV